MSATANAESVLRVACRGGDEGAKIYINGEYKDKCPANLFLSAGNIKLRVVMRVDSEHERVFEEEVYLGNDSAKKVKVLLSSPQLTASAKKARKLEKERKEKDVARAALAKAKTGDIEAMKAMAGYYSQGKGVVKSSEKAHFWNAKAVETTERNVAMFTLGHAEKGNIKAMEDMAQLYSQGKGVEQDTAKVKMWRDKVSTIRRKAKEEKATESLRLANSGNIDAMKEIAGFYQSGTGIEQSDAESQKWYKKAEIATSENIKKEKKEARDKEIRRELSKIDYSHNLQGMVSELKTYSPASSTTCYLPYSVFAMLSDLMSTPFKMTRQKSLEGELNARASRWKNPDSMIAKAYRQNNELSQSKEKTILSSR